MHIPDGYLSPSTCAVMFAGATPFWWLALRRLRTALNARLLPVLSLFSAFSFVIMTFNLPLPGGTTGHAVGMGIGAIVLGPWAAMVAISVALLIQALFFGDGGILCYGANCFNMAIVGSLAAYAIYRLLAARSELTAPRRAAAAAIAGYFAINISALCAAIEFGIQPALFHDATGAPLYAPYPLSIALPAMLLGHLAFAGIAEAVISGGVVAYLQKANPELLRASAPRAAIGESPVAAEPANVWSALRPFWLVLALLMVLSPLGLLAAGSAWGEWSAADLRNPQMRAQITLVSHGVAPPNDVPHGLQKLAAVWSAPFPDYAPSFLRSPQVGYVLSALLGVGLIILFCLLIGWFVRLLGERAPLANGAERL